MKRSILLVVAALVASPVFAADDLCTSNLASIKNTVSGGGNVSVDTKQDVMELQKEAETAKAAGDEKKCIDATNKAMKIIEDAKKGTY
ncbi:hypothetical protein NVV94_13720 [Pseudomonas sp. LS1212]|uniref:hypothetical protein n=1 Tax=Pseudomonas sp. LS1212 TaxID=2972478 RepID=UPI00215BD592|nr:hypothetical protein [Pseudomonas sp. LS1212]UVJ41773.1 hypothetical protein NVV94_13720 [Pseudomonas sp. LS1212]